MKLLNKPNDKNHIVYEQEIREDILMKYLTILMQTELVQYILTERMIII